MTNQIDNSNESNSTSTDERAEMGCSLIRLEVDPLGLENCNLVDQSGLENCNFIKDVSCQVKLYNYNLTDKLEEEGYSRIKFQVDQSFLENSNLTKELCNPSNLENNNFEMPDGFPELSVMAREMILQMKLEDSDKSKHSNQINSELKEIKKEEDDELESNLKDTTKVLFEIELKCDEQRKEKNAQRKKTTRKRNLAETDKGDRSTNKRTKMDNQDNSKMVVKLKVNRNKRAENRKIIHKKEPLRETTKKNGKTIKKKFTSKISRKKGATNNNNITTKAEVKVKEVTVRKKKTTNKKTLREAPITKKETKIKKEVAKSITEKKTIIKKEATKTFPKRKTTKEKEIISKDTLKLQEKGKRITKKETEKKDIGCIF